MARIAPFIGITYNPDRVGNLCDLIAPPCGAVPRRDQARYRECHPYNVMNLDFGKTLPGDAHPYDWQKRAGAAFREWVRTGVLVRRGRPGLYLVETDFTHPISGHRITRTGLTCLVRLEPGWPEGMIRPHERTFSSFRAERVSHLERLGAQLSPVFGVYEDPGGHMAGLLDKYRRTAPLIEIEDPMGMAHRLWAIEDAEAHRRLADLMLDKAVVIADGHHRYESAREFRRRKAGAAPTARPESPYDYLLFHLCAASDPGLLILPWYRLISRPLGLGREEFLEAVSRYFHVERYPFRPYRENEACAALHERLWRAGRDRTALGLYTRLEKAFYLLELRESRPRPPSLAAWPKPLRELDIVVLTGYILQDVLGMDEKDLDDPGQIGYCPSVREAVRSVDAREAEIAVLANPTRIAQVWHVAESGLTMPRKSTLFFPKVITGLVFHAYPA